MDAFVVHLRVCPERHPAVVEQVRIAHGLRHDGKTIRAHNGQLPHTKRFRLGADIRRFCADGDFRAVFCDGQNQAFCDVNRLLRRRRKGEDVAFDGIGDGVIVRDIGIRPCFRRQPDAVTAISAPKSARIEERIKGSVLIDDFGVDVFKHEVFAASQCVVDDARADIQRDIQFHIAVFNGEDTAKSLISLFAVCNCHKRSSSRLFVSSDLNQQFRCFSIL